MDQLTFPLYDSAEEATQAAIVRSVKEFKEVAHAVFPSLAPPTAYARLKAALNPEKPEKLTADEHALIARFTGQFDFLYYLAHALSHSRPSPVSPEDEAAALRRQVLQLGSDLKRSLDRLEQVEVRSPLRAAS